MDEYVSPNICPLYQMLPEPLSWLCSQLEDRQWPFECSLRFPSQTAWGRWHIGAKAALKAQLASQPASDKSLRITACHFSPSAAEPLAAVVTGHPGQLCWALTPGSIQPTTPSLLSTLLQL